MDDLLVIILTLIFAAIGAYGQIKKKRQNQESAPEENKSDNFWDFIDDEQVQNEQRNEGKNQQETYEAPEPVEEPAAQKPPATKYQFSPENEGASIYKNDLTQEIGDTKKEVKKNKKLKDFSLRKAVIYSEILNRKYQ